MRERITESTKRRRLAGAIIVGAVVAVVYAIIFTATVSPNPDGSFVSICGTVYKDSNCNGVIDAGDTGLSGVTISLYEQDGVTPAIDATGAVVHPLVTDANGHYCFMPDSTLLFARPFVVKETVPAGDTASNAVPGAGSGGTKQSNTSILVNSTTTGNTYQPNDFLLCVPPTTVNICGTVYSDLNNSGYIDTGDGKVANVTVELRTAGPDGLYCTADDVVVATMQTDANGYYCFMGVNAGTYDVHEVVPSGYTAVGAFPGPGSGGTALMTTCIKVVATTPGTTYKPNDFLIKTGPVNICGNVYTDLDNSGTINAGDGKLANVTIQLVTAGPDGLYCTPDDVIVATTMTNSNGYYCFMNIAPGTYGVHEVVPSGYTAVGSFPGVGSGGTSIDQDCIKVQATTPNTTYSPNDFLVKKVATGTVSICGTVYRDMNCNAILDSGDVPLGGIMVQLYDSTGHLLTTQSSSCPAGTYCFMGLVPGTYTVHVLAPTNYFATNALPGPSAVKVDVATIKVTATTGGQTYNNNNFLLCFNPPPTDNFTTETVTQGGWGAPPSGNNPGMLLKNNFSIVYPNGVTIGGNFTIKFTSAAAIQAFLPSGGTASVLTKNYVNPTTRTTAGVFAGQVLALELNVDFSAAGKLPIGLGVLKVASGPLAGYTVNQVLALCNTVLGGNTGALPPGVTVSTLNDVATAINENFDGGTNKGYLVH